MNGRPEDRRLAGIVTVCRSRATVPGVAWVVFNSREHDRFAAYIGQQQGARPRVI